VTDATAGLVAQATAGTVVPVVRELVLDAETPVGAYARIARPPFGFLLESAVGGERWARYSFLGTEPREVWRYRGRAMERWTRESGWEPAGTTGDPLTHMATLVRDRDPVVPPGLPPFIGGAVVCLGYDLVRSIERLPGPPPDTLGVPDAVVMIADTVIALDNLRGRAILVASVEIPPGADAAARAALRDSAEARLDALVARLRQPLALDPLPGAAPALPAASSRYAPAAFQRDVARLLDHIGRGDIFQAVLSRRLEVAGAVDAFRLYRALRALNPAPYLFHLALDDFAFLGSSPEVLVRVTDGDVTVRPIAGTRPRGATTTADDALADALRADEKERAEHLMLVDLGRNDVGRVAEFGSVRVTDLLALERYSHVMHLVSEVRGRLREGLDAFDALRACFPAGTVTGAPKVRAMELLDGLEPERRGPYAGAVGYVGWGARTLDTAIAIRSAVVMPDRVVVQAGAGVVADSDPVRELAETDAKARAVLAAIALAKIPG
jgi:anthranilate synthase component 1